MNKLLAVQGLRALAAALVVQAHALENYARKAMNGGDGVAYHGGGFGELGVQLFFCISGYIIFRSADTLPPGLSAAQDFLKKRIIRVVPLYWAVTFLYFLKNFAEGTPSSVATLLKSLFFIPFTDSSGLMRPLVGVGWSLNYEMLFYALVALSVVIASRRRAAVICGGLCILAAVGYFVRDGAPIHDVSSIFLLGNEWLAFFVAGLFVARISERLSDFRIEWGYAFIAASCIIATHIALLSSSSWYVTNSFPWSLLMCSAAVLTATLTHPQHSEEGLWADLIVKAGDCSYSTYLIHGTVLGISARIAGKLFTNDWSLLFSLLMVFFCTAVGYLVFVVFERPVTRRLNQVFLRKPRQPIAA